MVCGQLVSQDTEQHRTTPNLSSSSRALLCALVFVLISESIDASSLMFSVSSCRVWSRLVSCVCGSDPIVLADAFLRSPRVVCVSLILASCVCVALSCSIFCFVCIYVLMCLCSLCLDHDDGTCYYHDTYNFMAYGGYKNYLGTTQQKTTEDNNKHNNIRQHKPKHKQWIGIEQKGATMMCRCRCVTLCLYWWFSICLVICHVLLSYLVHDFVMCCVVSFFLRIGHSRVISNNVYLFPDAKIDLLNVEFVEPYCATSQSGRPQQT